MIIAQLATIPERAALLPRVVESLAKQVDQLVVMFNDYDEPPEWVDKVSNLVPVTKLDNKGDCEKFWRHAFWEGYYIFTCDDDLIYPPDYVETMIRHIERYNRKAIITLHGRTFPPRPIRSYYRGKLKGYHWNTEQYEDVQVDAGGTGVMCWHSDTFRVPYDEITDGNMADVWVAVFARRQQVPIMCVAHRPGWLEYIGPPESDENPQTIWSCHHNDDALQTQIYNQ